MNDAYGSSTGASASATGANDLYKTSQVNKANQAESLYSAVNTNVQTNNGTYRDNGAVTNNKNAQGVYNGAYATSNVNAPQSAYSEANIPTATNSRGTASVYDSGAVRDSRSTTGASSLPTGGSLPQQKITQQDIQPTNNPALPTGGSLPQQKITPQDVTPTNNPTLPTGGSLPQQKITPQDIQPTNNPNLPTGGSLPQQKITPQDIIPNTQTGNVTQTAEPNIGTIYGMSPTDFRAAIGEENYAKFANGQLSDAEIRSLLSARQTVMPMGREAVGLELQQPNVGTIYGLPPDQFRQIIGEDNYSRFARGELSEAEIRSLLSKQQTVMPTRNWDEIGGELNPGGNNPYLTGGQGGNGWQASYEYNTSDLTDQINDMRDKAFENARAQIENQLAQGELEIDQAIAKVPEIYQAGINDLAAQYQISKNNANEYFNSYGLASGARAQATLAMNNVYQANMAAYQMEQANAIQEYENQRAQLRLAAQGQITEALLQNEQDRASDLLAEYQRQDEYGFKLFLQKLDDNYKYYALETDRQLKEAAMWEESRQFDEQLRESKRQADMGYELDVRKLEETARQADNENSIRMYQIAESIREFDANHDLSLAELQEKARQADNNYNLALAQFQEGVRQANMGYDIDLQKLQLQYQQWKVSADLAERQFQASLQQFQQEYNLDLTKLQSTLDSQKKTEGTGTGDGETGTPYYWDQYDTIYYDPATLGDDFQKLANDLLDANNDGNNPLSGETAAQRQQRIYQQFLADHPGLTENQIWDYLKTNFDVQ